MGATMSDWDLSLRDGTDRLVSRPVSRLWFRNGDPSLVDDGGRRIVGYGIAPATIGRSIFATTHAIKQESFELLYDEDAGS